MQDQVTACIITADGARATTCSLVKDGVTSLSVFSAPCNGIGGSFPVSNIGDLLGILKQHGNIVTLTYDKVAGKLKVKSGKKQTTITSNENCRAFLHTPTLLADWTKQSMIRITKFGLDGSYELKDGTRRQPILSLEVDANDLYEALRCDSINNQKMNKYVLVWNSQTRTLYATVGNYTKGKTTTEIVKDDLKDSRTILSTYGGGLDYVLKSVNGKITVAFLDFVEEGQGTPLVLLLHDGDFIFQASILGEEEK